MAKPAIEELPLPSRLRIRMRGWAGAQLRRARPHDGEVWDRPAGVETELPSHLADLTVVAGSAEHGHLYSPTPPRLVRAWLDEVAPSADEACTFVDMGPGRGRTLLMASEKPFRRVVGVEFTRELNEAALRDIQRFRGRGGAAARSSRPSGTRRRSPSRPTRWSSTSTTRSPARSWLG